MKILKKLFQKKPKILALPEGYKVIEAFELLGVKYYQFDTAFQVPAGRMMANLTFYAELEMRCDRTYLEKHIRATELILNGQNGKISLTDLALINGNLKERLNLTPFPDYIYKIASVMFFDITESPDAYDYEYNLKKIDIWKKSEGVLSFFLKHPLKELIPFLESVGENAPTFFQVAEQINALHQRTLREIISRG